MIYLIKTIYNKNSGCY